MAECVATVTLGGGFVVGRGSEAELGSSIGIFSYFLQGCCDDSDFDKTNAFYLSQFYFYESSDRSNSELS